uniref:Protein sleepless n=1 Tax=Timema monikensis TaxID=170555 RepID=A0A7R9HTA6_9NEOP|nr:unnamed protein product [Timema monikensis]
MVWSSSTPDQDSNLDLPVVGSQSTTRVARGAIKCFECNSHNDSRCSLDVLPVELKKDCSEHKEGTKYTMCRKIVQHIDFEVNGSTANEAVCLLLALQVMRCQMRMRTGLRWLVLGFDWFSSAEHLRQSGRSRDKLNFNGTARTD